MHTLRDAQTNSRSIWIKPSVERGSAHWLSILQAVLFCFLQTSNIFFTPSAAPSTLEKIHTGNYKAYHIGFEHIPSLLPLTAKIYDDPCIFVILHLCVVEEVILKL